ncbi:MobA/MobL family protein [Pseudoxanthomonas winnipegensis]|uniref:MobA/MobL family protein n=1 Tax=Pseudoxanthomonas winnipegensis TaxID=2480810 RepID=UPI003CE4F247
MLVPNTHIQTYSRAKGDNALAIAASLGGLLLTDPRTGQGHDFRGRGHVVRVRIMIPENAPPWADDPQALWLAAEQAEKRRDSTVGRSFRITLPRELDSGAQWDLVLDVTKRLVDRYGFAVQMSYHVRPCGEDVEAYANLLATTRRMDACGLTVKTRVLDGHINGRAEIEQVRAMVDEEIFRHLHQANVPDQSAQLPRSFRDQLIARRGEGPLGEPNGFEALLLNYRDRLRSQAKLSSEGAVSGLAMTQGLVASVAPQLPAVQCTSPLVTAQSQGPSPPT